MTSCDIQKQHNMICDISISEYHVQMAYCDCKEKERKERMKKEELTLVQEWDKTFAKSEKVEKRR